MYNFGQFLYFGAIDLQQLLSSTTAHVNLVSLVRSFV
jgi:hypothetical protein